MRRSVEIALILTTLTWLAACGPQRPPEGRGRTAAGQPAVNQPAAPARAEIAPLVTGRFQVVFSPHDREDTFLVDTMTGRVWQLQQREDLKGAPSEWEHMDRLDTRADDYVFDQEHPARASHGYR